MHPADATPPVAAGRNVVIVIDHAGARVLLVDPEAGATPQELHHVPHSTDRSQCDADGNSDLGMRTAIGVGVCALLGHFTGPVGVAAGVAGAAAMSLAAAPGVGALADAAVGATADAVTQIRRETAAYESYFTLKHGQSALVAEISEDRLSVLDDATKPLGGTIYRRMNNAATNAAFGAQYDNNYLYPYYCEPMYS